RIQATPSTLDNWYLFCRPEEKLGLLVRFLQRQKACKVIVFLATCASVDFFSKVLGQLSPMRRHGIPVLALHGQLAQKKRVAAYERFLALPAGVLGCTDVAARGVDIPDVHWIVQYDAPTDPAFFVHRVGRTARAGRSGRSLTLLQPEEDAYVEFLALRKVPMHAMDDAQACAEIWDPYPEVKRMVRADRDLLEKGTRAFISFLRDYKEHHCQFIFRFAHLDLGAIARAFALLRLPKMPELRDAA
ncbi:unnamed protein product, partial [Phaeothamnion confervicola]